MDLFEDEFRVRLFSAIFLIALAGAVVLLGGYFYVSVLLLLALVAMAEYIRIVVVEYGDDDEDFRRHIKWAILFIGVPFISMINIRNTFQDGVRVTFWLIAVISVVDSMAYVVGKGIGKRHVFSVSPNKTLEGMIGGVLAGTIAGTVLAYFFMHVISIYLVLPISFIVSVLAQLGDLAESSFKRRFYVKNSSDLIPGHGGFLDRFDGYLFASPFTLLTCFVLRGFLGVGMFA